MKQLYQIPKSGDMYVEDVPLPQLMPGMLLVRVAASLVSAGTERMAVDFAQKSLFQKAKSRPDLVRQVIDKARREGIFNTLEAANRKLDQPQSLGYSCAGTIIGIGEERGRIRYRGSSCLCGSRLCRPCRGCCCTEKSDGSDS